MYLEANESKYLLSLIESFTWSYPSIARNGFKKAGIKSKVATIAL